MAPESIKPESVGMDILDIPIPVKAYLGPIVLEIPAKPAQVAIVVRMATQELLAAGIIRPGESLWPREPTREDQHLDASRGPRAQTPSQAEERKKVLTDS
jgi:hypothetical protein